MTTDEPHQVVNRNYLQIFVELPKLAKVAPEDMSPGERFLNAMGQLYDWDSRPSAYQDKSLDRLFDESSYDGLTGIEMARKLKELGVDVVAIAKATGLSVADVSSY